MKRWYAAFFLVILVLLTLSHLGGQQNGIGFIFVEPTGITGKIWMASRHSLAGAVGWAGQKNNPLLVQVDYLPPPFLLLTDDNLRVAFYYGLGGRLVLEGEAEGGFRFPLGLDFISRTAPLNFFFEVVPVLDLSPKARITLKGALGIRYLFRASTRSKV